ncbi:MAG: FecR domain-containing protein [Burkholderiales bacterium]|jgi:hypothetical protein|nr:FecR domain-containing protein [Burkholderiales bacterium]
MHVACSRALVFACLMLTLPLALAADAGRVKTSKGTVTIDRAGQRLPATVGMPVQEKDVLSTGADGSVGISFTDNSMLSAGPNSVLILDKYAFDAASGKGALEANLARGTLAAVSGKMVKASPESMKIRTPAAIMGVRGTEFVVKVDDPVR